MAKKRTPRKKAAPKKRVTPKNNPDRHVDPDSVNVNAWQVPNLDIDELRTSITKECKKRATTLGADPIGSPVFEDRIKMVDKKEWDHYIETVDSIEVDMPWVHDQNGDGQCTCEATSTAYEVQDFIDDGAAVRHSPAHLYKRINGGVDRGSNIDRALEEIAENGLLPAPNQGFEHSFPLVGWRNRHPVGWTSTAERFKATEWMDIATSEGFVNALFRRWPVVWGRRGHAICAVKLIKVDGILYIRSRNSWGQYKLYLTDSFSTLQRYIDYYGAWALCSTKLRTNESTGVSTEPSTVL